MPPLRPILILAATALACLLPSCKQWFIGEHLRAADTIYSGVDIFHPVDGKIHFNPKQDKEHLNPVAYVVAPEVTYYRQPPCYDVNIHCIGDWSHEPGATVYSVRPTGRVVTAKIGYGGFQEIVPELPRGLATYDAPTRDIDSIEEMQTPYIVCTWRPDHPYPDAMGSICEPKKEKPSFAYRALTETCDYVVDPVLNVLTPVVETVGIIAAAPICVPAGAIVNAAQQQQVETDEASEAGATVD